MWFQKKTPQPKSLHGKLEIFSRHCFFSDASPHKQRHKHFSRQACARNLLRTFDPAKANLTFLLDISKGKDHFLCTQNEFPVVEINQGTEAGAFLALLDYLESLSLHPETPIYLVEDDYVHREGWTDVLLEGLQIPGIDYVTLYDHKDKYTDPMYQNLTSKLLLTQSCHWRTIPSTTQTFAARWKTLQRDLSIHRRYSRNRKISADHQKFLTLGATLISPIPGWSTHAEPPFASPGIDWETLLQQESIP